jgi:Txe/YoeB family toxin of Txe-Axe toxin-antitoxin module
MPGRLVANVVAVVVLALVGTARAAENGKLVKADGQVFVKPPSGAEAAARKGDTIPAGSQVRTGADGAAEITFADGSILRMTKASSILLSANKRQKEKNSILLFFGRVWSKVAPSKDGGTSYEVGTANAVCGVRGTEFETQVADDGSMRMQVTEGKVAVDGDGGEQVAGPGQQVEADEQSVSATEGAQDQANYDKWQKQKGERLKKSSEAIVKTIKGKVLSRQQKIESLRAEQKDLEQKRKGAEGRAKEGDQAAIDEIRGYNQRLAAIADQIADLGDEATAQVGMVDHFADLVNDPRFRGISRKYIELEAASLRRVKANLDKMVAEGTDMSIESMNKMLDDMSKGKGTLREKSGSSTKDLFGDDELKKF